MEAWRKTWRDGFAVVLPIQGLVGLLAALEKDDQRLLTGATCWPPPLQSCQNDFTEKACGIAWAAAYGAPDSYPVGELETLFAKACWDASALLGDGSACRYFLSYWDETPREQLRKQMIPELRLAISNRASERPAA